MSNKIQLQTNNTSLDGYITRINAAKDVAANLPEAGGSGGSVEAWTGTVYGANGLGTYPNIWIYYTDETLTCRSIMVEPRSEKIITIAANTLICVTSSYDTIPDAIDPDGMVGVVVYLPTQNNFEI